MVRIRAAHAGDVPVLEAVVAEAYRHYVPRLGRRPAPMGADYAAITATGRAWVAEADGRIAGLIVLTPAPDHLLVENLAVDPAVQGRGIGSRLLDFADGHARALGLFELRLYTNEKMTENLAYYPRHGYVETHRAEEAGFHRVYFTKVLR